MKILFDIWFDLKHFFYNDILFRFSFFPLNFNTRNFMLIHTHTQTQNQSINQSIRRTGRQITNGESEPLNFDYYHHQLIMCVCVCVYGLEYYSTALVCWYDGKPLGFFQWKKRKIIISDIHSYTPLWKFPLLSLLFLLLLLWIRCKLNKEFFV